MNSLNTDTGTSLNQTKYRPIDLSNQYYQPNLFYRIPNNTSIAPEFAPLQNPYGANQLLATQFSFQYSDNQGLGEGLAGGNHSGAWTGNGSQQRNNPPIDPSHFYSLPAHAGHAQTSDQNLYYPYGYSATNNMYWPHPSVLANSTNNNNNNNVVGSNTANAINHSTSQLSSAPNPATNHHNPQFSLPGHDKAQPWPDTLLPNQYSPLNYKCNISPNIDQLLPPQIITNNNNNHNSTNSTNNGNGLSNYEFQLSSNGYHISQVAVKMPPEDRHSLHEDRTSNRKPETSNNLDSTTYSTSNDPIDINLDMDSLQSHLTKNCSLNADNNSNSCQQSLNPYSTIQSFSKQNTTNNNNSCSSVATDFWSSEAGKISNFNATKSYAKAAKLPSRTVTHIPNSSSSAYYMDNGYNGNTSRSNYKPTTNGFATGFVKPSGGNANWFNGQNWNASKTKWSMEGTRGPLSQTTTDTSPKSSWPSKTTLSNSDELLRNAEYRIKEIQLQINPKRLDINLDKTRYFVIKSYSEDDVHRSIKYKIWCSTKEGNRRLNEAFLGAQKTGGHVLLFFSVNGSGHFCGVAEMTSTVDEAVVTGVWCQDKWRGKFSVRWLYVKDVPNTQLRHISTKVKIQKGGGGDSSSGSATTTTTEVKPITNLRDATELKSDRGPGASYKDDAGYQALRIIMDCKSTMSIFDDFLHYEKRELGIDNTM